VKLVHLYLAPVGATVRQTLAAGVAGLALSHTIGAAVLQGLFTRWHAPAVASPDRTAWIAVLLVQSLPYLCALLMSLISALPLPASWIGTAMRPRDQRPENADAAAEAGITRLPLRPWF
jgi:hypothetical protein